MDIRCTNCKTSKRDSGRIFSFCRKCDANYCSRCKESGNSCPRCGHKYLERGG